MATLSSLITPTNIITAENPLTLTNKTISGASNTLTNIPLSTAVTGTLPVANGGTGATTASGARTALSAAASGANSDITSLSGLSTALSVAQGGTGATSLSGVLKGNGTAAFTASAVNLASEVTGTLPVANGGTGATAAAGARTNLGSTTVGDSFFTLVNPSAITFPRINANNTVSALSAADFRTAIGAGTGGGSVTSVAATAGTGISISGSPITTSGTLNITNTGVTSLSAGSGISLSGSTGAVTITGTGGGSWTWISRTTLSNTTSLTLTIPTGYDNVVILFSNMRANNYTQMLTALVQFTIAGSLRTDFRYFSSSVSTVPGSTNFGNTALYGQNSNSSSLQLWYAWGSPGQNMITRARSNGSEPYASAQIWIGGTQNVESFYTPNIWGTSNNGTFSIPFSAGYYDNASGRIESMTFTFSGSGGSGGFGVNGFANIYGIKNS